MSRSGRAALGQASTKTAARELEHSLDLLPRDTGEPLQEIVQPGAVFEIAAAVALAVGSDRAGSWVVGVVARPTHSWPAC
jgi:hypothetical protein